MTDKVAAIRKALYPQWQWTGGYITVEVTESQVILRGYDDPDPEEKQMLITKVEAIAGVKPHWQRLGTKEPPVALG